MNWISHPLILYGLVALALGLTLLLFLAVKQEIRRVDRRFRAAEKDWGVKKDSARDVLDALRKVVEELQSSIAETDKKVALLNPAVPVARGMNLNKRSEALRMARRGAQPEEISASLRLPRNEVILLLKIHRIVLKSL